MRLTEVAPFEVAGNPVDPAGLRVTVGVDEVRLEAKVMLVLIYLAEHAGRVVSRAELEEALWPGRVVTEDSVTKAIAKLRRVFGDDRRHPRVIETLPKSGYRLIAEISRRERGAASAAATPGMTDADAGGNGYSRRIWILGSGALVLLALYWSTAEWDRFGAPPSPPPDARLASAISPFENLGRVPEDDYFANGIAADLVTDLSKLGGLLVVASRTAFSYRDSRSRPQEIISEPVSYTHLTLPTMSTTWRSRWWPGD